MKKLFLFSVFLLTIVFSYTVTVQDLLLLKKSNDISLSENIQCLLDKDVDTSVKKKIQNFKTHSSLFIVNLPDRQAGSSLPTGIYSYHLETMFCTQSQKAILKL